MGTAPVSTQGLCFACDPCNLVAESFIRLRILDRLTPRTTILNTIHFQKPVKEFCSLFDLVFFKWLSINCFSISEHGLYGTKTMSVTLNRWLLRAHNALSTKAFRKLPKPRRTSLLRWNSIQICPTLPLFGTFSWGHGERGKIGCFHARAPTRILWFLRINWKNTAIFFGS